MNSLPNGGDWVTLLPKPVPPESLCCVECTTEDEQGGITLRKDVPVCFKGLDLIARHLARVHDEGRLPIALSSTGLAYISLDPYPTRPLGAASEVNTHDRPPVLGFTESGSLSLSRGRATAIRSLAITPDLLAHALQNPEEPIRAFLSADVATIVTDANVWDTPDALPAEQFLSLCGRKLLVVRTHEDTGTPSFRTIVAMDHGMLLPYPHATHGSCTIQATVSGQKSTSANRAPHTAWDPNVYKRRLTAGKELTAEELGSTYQQELKQWASNNVPNAFITTSSDGIEEVYVPFCVDPSDFEFGISLGQVLYPGKGKRKAREDHFLAEVPGKPGVFSFQAQERTSLMASPGQPTDPSKGFRVTSLVFPAPRPKPEDDPNTSVKCYLSPVYSRFANGGTLLNSHVQPVLERAIQSANIKGYRAPI